MNLLGGLMGGGQKGGNNSSLMWIVVIFLLAFYSNASSFLGLESLFGMNNNFNNACNDNCGSKKHYKDNACCEPMGPPPIFGPFNNFLGGNGLFIIGILALLFLCGDDEIDDGIDEACGTSIVEVE